MQGTWGYRRVLSAFGDAILGPTGEIDRAALGQLVFADAVVRRKLNQATHVPIMLEVIKQLLGHWLRFKQIVVIDMPLLFETGAHKLVGLTVLVACSPDVQLQRLMLRDGSSSTQAQARIDAQMPLAEKVDLADIVLMNDGSVQQLQEQASACMDSLQCPRVTVDDMIAKIKHRGARSFLLLSGIVLSLAYEMASKSNDLSMESSKLARSVSNVSSMTKRELPIKRLIGALLAISLGTIIEWYDFTIYTQMSKILGKVFFPSGNPTLQALSFWGVFFIGYISRPAGAVLFGHLGDTRGRGMCLLISVLVMGIPTVLIGCLPGYSTMGIAAPIILALLRLIQGLAMGGEVYLHEIADPRYRALTGSLGYISLGIGVVIGILAVVMIVNLVHGEALLVWGWRLPFLFAIFTLVAAIVLRYNMPESVEFATSREEIDQDYHRRAKQHKRSVSRTRSSNDSAEKAKTDAQLTSDASVKGADVSDVESQGLEKHYVPLMELFRGYWSGLLLQMGYEAWIGASFYLGYSWLPSFFVTYVGINQTTTLWMVLTSMVLFTFVVPIAGILADKGQPRVTATIVIAVIAGATSVPMFLAFQTKHMAACWLLQAVTLALTAYTMGLLPVICSSIYPAGVRISGFNLGYNLGMTVFGGVSPLIMTAIQTSTGSIFIGPGLWMTGMAIITIACSMMLIKVYPLTNHF
eukprot:gene13429-13557_t